MATIKEDYCSYEVAKMLKEKGFEGDINAYYHIWDNGNKVCSAQEFSHSEAPHLYIPAPTHQMAIKWLRIKHSILLFLLPAQENGKLVYLVEVWTWNEEKGIYESTYAPMPRKEPEEAVEAALKYVLENLI